MEKIQMAKRPGAPGLKFTVSVGGKRKTFESIEAAAKYFKISYTVLYQRLFTMKWPAAKAVTTKVRKMKAKKVKAKARRKK